MDNISGIELIKLFAFSKIPQHGGAVLASRCAQGAVRGHSHGVHIVGVADKVVAELAVLKRPDLDNLVPTSRYDDGSRGVG